MKNSKKHIRHWISLHEENDGALLIHEDMDYEAIIGCFKVQETLMSEKKIGTIEEPHYYTVSVLSHEGMTPHFHIYDKQGRKKNRRKKKGKHACVQILTNKYFKHGKHQDELDDDIQATLDAFMRTVRTEDKHDEGIGKTNYQYTISQWNEEMDTKGKPNWINPLTTPQPNYTTIT